MQVVGAAHVQGILFCSRWDTPFSEKRRAPADDELNNAHRLDNESPLVAPLRRLQHEQSSSSRLAPGIDDTTAPGITIGPHRSGSAVDGSGTPDGFAGFVGCARPQHL